jgi:hypothetical protein
MNKYVCFDFLYNFRLKHFSFYEESEIFFFHRCTKILLSSTRYSCQILINLEFSRQIFQKYSNMKFHGSPSSVGRAVSCGKAYKQTDVTKTTTAFSDSANAPQNCFKAQ